MTLKDWLAQNERSVSWLARQAGVSRPLMSRIIDRMVEPKIMVARRITGATGGAVTEDDMLLPERPRKISLAKSAT